MSEVGEILDGLGCTLSLDEGDLVAGAVVVAKVVDSAGQVRLASSWSDGMSWIERVGMLRVAERTELPPEGAGWEVDDE